MSISTITNKDNLLVMPNNPSDAYQIGYAIGYQDGKCDTASPWHRVEEPPKLYELVPNEFYVSTMLVMFWHGWYYVGYALSDEKNGPVRWVKDGLTISPTHWMPIEPPKEGNNGSSRKEAGSDL